MCNVLPFHEIEKVHCTDTIKPTEVPLRSYSGHTIKPAGFVTLPVKYKDRTINLNFHVVKMIVKPILGVNSCEGLGLVSRVYQLENSGTPSDIQKEYSEVFQGLGCMPGEYTVKVDPNVTRSYTQLVRYHYHFKIK